MANQFGSYSPIVPLGTTWQETIQLLQSDQVTPVDLTGFDVHAQLRTATPTISGSSATPAPTIEFTTTGFYGSSPTWPVVEGFSVPTPTNGTILLDVSPSSYTSIVSPTNAKAKFVWEIRLVNKVTGYTQPVVSGKPTFLPAVTI